MFFEKYLPQLIQSLVIIVILLLIRWLLIRAVNKFAKKIERLEHRTRLIDKHIDFAAIFFIILGLIFVWGVEVRDLGLVMSSVFAVIGIGFFAQWSILSNVTSGVIMFFTFPYKIGDFIKIHDKDYPYEGIIEDIKAFHLIIHTNEGEVITYPNSLLMQKGVTIIKVDDFHLPSPEVDENVKELPLD